jgi:pentose-5-phosphate-3-epimerase
MQYYETKQNPSSSAKIIVHLLLENNESLSARLAKRKPHVISIEVKMEMYRQATTEDLKSGELNTSQDVTQISKLLF